MWIIQKKQNEMLYVWHWVSVVDFRKHVHPNTRIICSFLFLPPFLTPAPHMAMKSVDQRVMSNSQTRMLISDRYVIWSVWRAVHVHTSTCEMVTSITLILMRSVFLCSFSTPEFFMFVHVFWDDKSLVWLHSEEFCFMIFAKLAFVHSIIFVLTCA